MKFLLLLILASRASAIEINGPLERDAITPDTVDASTITITGSGAKCFSADDPTIVIDCNLNRAGFGTASPATALDVNGNAQFGSGSTKSTFTVAGALNLAEALSVGSGGTGVTSLVSGGVLFGGSPITASAVLSNGQLLIGDGTTAPTLATLTATTNETEITNGAGTVTVGIPDSINIVSTLTVQGNAFSVGVSTLVVTSGRLGVGTASPSTGFHMSSGTLTIDGTAGAINVGNASFNPILRAGTGNFANGVLVRFIGAYAGISMYDTEANALANGVTGRDLYADGNGWSVRSALDYGFSSTADAAGTQDTNISRISAGVLGIGTGAAGSTAGTITGVMRPLVRTKAQLDVITPVVGDVYICSDCSAPYSMCVATGAVISGFRRSDSTTIGCGSQN